MYEVLSLLERLFSRIQYLEEGKLGKCKRDILEWLGKDCSDTIEIVTSGSPKYIIQVNKYK